MPIVTRNSGLRITVPPTHEISEIARPGRKRGPGTRLWSHAASDRPAGDSPHERGDY